MIRPKLALSTLATAAGLVLSFGAPRGDYALASDCPDVLGGGPILVYDVSGSTLLGPLHRHLAVYDDGHASYSAAGGLPGAQPEAVFTYVGEKAAAQLLADLRAAGAFQLCDAQLLVSDVPLTTVTVLTPGTDARAHSFSYWIPTTAGHQQVEQVIQTFLDERFQ